ncbi:DUF4957 domain-containing protein [Dysgonomonas sp. 511]|uniref:DUF4957 domain-containing protein n=1 Tax=Dysgonomonas sp. 511 TaxID=2302930 RepID=UPI0013D57D40|nr:DUF4957 domain-containing protein [Dysgonomonas sp. 511]NDV77978.1 DUF4957 domain-containing protein [Dysgonomonas sp. 511]
MNKLTNLIYLLGLSLVTILAGCSDPDDEIKTIDYDRLFSPTEMSARVINRLEVRLSWAKNVKNADSYTIEIYENGDLDFSGEPVKVLTGINENPMTITGLESETSYSIRIQAVSATIPSSKWIAATVTTDGEQIISSVDNITETGATINWTPGESADAIILTPGNLSFPITASDVAAGKITVTGLESNTRYTAKLMNGTKSRGTTTFTTLVDPNAAIIVEPGDDLQTVLTNAASGKVLAMKPGTYGEAKKIIVNKDVEIKAYYADQDKPVINANISLEDGAKLLLENIVLDGANTDANQAIMFNTAETSYGDLTIENCVIRNHEKGLYYLNKASSVSSITINNTIIHNIVCTGGDLLDSRVGGISAITLTNSTIYKSCTARDLIRYDDASANFSSVTPLITVENCTLDGVCNSTDKRILYVRFKNHSISFKNNIVSNSAGGIFSDNSATATPAFSGNTYFKSPNFLQSSSTSTKAKFYDGSSPSTLDPGYVDAANGDFTVTNIDVAGGDPRWIK